MLPVGQYYTVSQSEVLHPSRLRRGWRLIDLQLGTGTLVLVWNSLLVQDPLA